MKQTVLKFLRAEDGASTADMTILSAALIGLALALTTQVSGGIENLTVDISSALEDRDTGPAW